MAELTLVPELPSLAWPIDRSAAAVRGLWRFFAATLVGVALYVPLHDVAWSLLWRNQRLIALSSGLIIGMGGGAAIGLTWAGLRWLALAAWPGPLGVRVDSERIVIDAGPFGHEAIDWRRAVVTVDGDLDLEQLATLPPDAVGVHLTHPACHGDVLDLLRRYLGVHGSRLSSDLGPFLLRAASSTAGQ